jgi:hypothetical protein
MNEEERNKVRDEIERVARDAEVWPSGKHYEAKGHYNGEAHTAKGMDEESARRGLVHIIWGKICKGSMRQKAEAQTA